MNSNGLLCDLFREGSNKKNEQIKFTGGSELGRAQLKSDTGMSINFLVGKKYASLSNQSEHQSQMCAGFFLFEKEGVDYSSIININRQGRFMNQYKTNNNNNWFGK